MYRYVALALLVGSVSLTVAQQGQKPGGSYGNWLPGSSGKDKGKDKEDANVRAVQGSVKNADESPAEGAIVQVKNTKTMQIRSFITKADGIFTFTGLAANVDYEIRAERKGMQSATRTISTFDDRKRVIINLRLEDEKK